MNILLSNNDAQSMMWVGYLVFLCVSHPPSKEKKEKHRTGFKEKENTHDTDGRTDGRTEAKSRANNELLLLLFSFFSFLLLLLCGGGVSKKKKKKKHSSQQKRRI